VQRGLNLKQLLTFAELTFSSPETVARQLLATPPKESLSEEHQTELLKIGGPPVRLALARSSLHEKLVRKIFQESTPSSATRLGSLANPNIRPIALFADEPALAAWIKTAPNVDLSALFMNPRVDSNIIADILEKEPPFDDVSEDTHLEIIRSLAENQRMSSTIETSDGYEEHTYNHPFRLAVELAQTCPTSPPWAHAMASLLERMPAECDHTLALAAAKRWTGKNAASEDKEVLKSGNLSSHQRVRFVLARLGMGSMFMSNYIPDAERSKGLIASPDPAMRAAVYSFGRLSSDEVRSALKKDKEFAFSFFIDNDWIWSNRERQQFLKEYYNDLPFESELPRLHFSRKTAQIRRDHPEWIVESDDSEEQQPDSPTRDDILAISENINHLSLARSQVDAELLARLDLAIKCSRLALIAAFFAALIALFK